MHRTAKNPARSRPEDRNRWRVIFRQILGKPECPYLIRWTVETPWGSVRLHHWLRGDDPRAMHDHPWDFWTCVLWGSYTDLHMRHGKLSEGVVHEIMRPFRPRFRRAGHIHTVETRGCWSLLLTGPHVQFWGFYRRIRNSPLFRFVKANKWHLEEGGVPCQG